MMASTAFNAGIANLCVSGIFFALWAIDRSARHNLLWGLGFAALAVTAIFLPQARDSNSGGAYVVAVVSVAIAIPALLGGLWRYIGRDIGVGRLLIAAIGIAILLFMAGNLAPRSTTRLASLLLGLNFLCFGAAMIRRTGFERLAGALFVVRGGLVLYFPALDGEDIATAFVLLHALTLITGLALLFTAVLRMRSKLAVSEAKLLDRLAQFDALYSNTPALLTVADYRQRLTAASDDWLKFMGYSREEVIGRDRFDFIAPHSKRIYTNEVFPRLKAEFRADDIMNDVVKKDGTIAHFRTSARSHFNPLTGHYDVIVVSVDETAKRRAEEDMRKAQNLLARVVDGMPAAVTVKDRDLRVVLWNTVAERLFDLKAEQVLGRRLSEAAPRPGVDRMERIDRAVMAGEIPPPSELRFDVGGEKRWILMNKLPLLSSDGEIQGVMSLSLDITDLKIARNELLRAQRLGRIGFLRVDYKARRITWSETLFEIRGVAPRDYFPLEQATNHIHPDDRPIYRAARNAGFAEKRRFQAEVRFVRPDGGIGWEHMVGEPEFGQAGEESGLLLIIQDITERKLAEDALRRSELRFAGAFQGSTDMMAMIQHHRFVEVNDSWLATLGYEKSEVIGKTVRDLGLYADPEQVDAVWREMARSGQVVNWDARFRGKDGGIRDTVMSGARLGPAEDELWFWTIRDVTEIRATEDRLRQSQRLEAIGKLTGGVAHDFNNLLAVITGNLELIRERLKDGDPSKNSIRTALRAAERGASLTQSLLAFSRLQPLSPRAVDVGALVGEMSDLVGRTVPGNIEFRIDVPTTLWRCTADPGQLQNALLNLVMNARDAMPAGGTLTIACANESIERTSRGLGAGDYVRLSVADTGDGMSPEVMQRAFEPFFTTKDVGKGTGLGLSMVYGFANQSGGHVAIESALGRGTTVDLRLPRARGDGETRAETRDMPAGRGEVLLVVEDDADLLKLYVAQLQSLGYVVFGSSDAEKALRILSERPEIAALITDVMLPVGVDGDALARKARMSKPDLEVIFTSGYVDHASAAKIVGDDAGRFLRKPFSKSELARKLREILDKSGTP